MLCFLTQPKESRNELKNKKQAECQKIKLHGILTTKELKKHSCRLVGGAETGSRVQRMPSKATDHAGEVGAGGPGGSTFLH